MTRITKIMNLIASIVMWRVPSKTISAVVLLLALLMPITAPIPVWAYSLNIPAPYDDSLRLTAPPPSLLTSMMDFTGALYNGFAAFVSTSVKEREKAKNLHSPAVLGAKVGSIYTQLDAAQEIEVGQALSLTAIPLDKSGKVLDGLGTKWVSSNPGVLKVSADSQAVALNIGDATLTVTAGKTTQNFEVHVLPGVKPEAPSAPMLVDDDELGSLISPENNLGSPMGQVEAQARNVAAATQIRERAGSANYSFNVPIASLPGRGTDASVGLTYNSRVWTKIVPDGNAYYFNFDRNWVTPGFTLGYGFLDVHITTAGSSPSTHVYEFMMSDSNGTRHQIPRKAGTTGYREYESTDGSFIKAGMFAGDEKNAPTLDFKYADGTTVTYGVRTPDNRYGSPDQGRRYPVKITDVNGNVINITYVNGDTDGKILSIKDTLSRYIYFYYNGPQLSYVTVPGYNGSSTAREAVRFYYDTLTFASGTRFSDGTNTDLPASTSVLKYVYYPGTASGYKYDYSAAWGTINKISSLRGMTVNSTSVTSQGEVAATTEYNYPTTVTTLSDVPTYTTRTDDWLGRTTLSAPVTSFSVVKNTTAGRTESRITSPDGTIQESWMTIYPGNWQDGLVTDTFVKTTTPSLGDTVWSHTKLFWDDQSGVSGRSNPRIIKTEIIDDANQTRAMTMDYDGYNNPTVVKEYDFGDDPAIDPELRKTETTYVTGASWINNNLLHLPQSVKTTVNSTVVSRTDYEYDGYAMTLYGAGITQHDPRFNPDSPPGETCVMVCPPGCENPVHTQICDCDLEEVCTPSYIYDDGTAYRGNLTKTTQFVDPTNNSDPKAAVNTMKYDVVGNRVEASMDCCNVMTTEYASANHYAYPTKQTKGSSPQLITESTYDFNTGLVTSSEDENDQDTNITYDSSSLRQTRIDFANGAWNEFEYNLSAYPYSVKTTSSLDSSRSISVWNYLNGSNHGFRTRQQTANGYISNDTEFDNMGRAVKSYNPYTVSSLTAGLTSGTKFTEATEIDPLGRTLKTTMPDSTISTASYSGATATLTDQAGKKRRQVGDALGRIVRVDEPNSSGNLDSSGSPVQPSHYQYDGNNNLIKVTQSDGTNTQERAFKYDALSRLTHERQVEASPTLDIDGVKGTASSTKWTRVYIYDTENLLTETIDARGVKGTYGYDGLKRPTSITYTGESGYQTPQVTLTYDEVHSGYYNKGRVTKVKTAAVSVTGQSTPETIHNYDYDKVGQVVNHTQSIGSQSYSLQYGYNLAGQLVSETYPSGKVINSTVDNYGVVQTIADSQKSYLTGLTFNNQGALSQISFGNGTTESYGYNDRLQMTSQSLQKGSNVLQKYEYSFGTVDLSNGNIDSTKNNGQLGKIEGYIGSTKQWSQRLAHDELGRLSESREYKSGDNGQLTYKQKFEFDRFGNLYRKSASNPTSGQANPLVYTPIENSDISKTTNRFTSGLTYNEAGQVTADTKFRGMGFLYDAYGRLVKATKTSVPDALTVYDALGYRVATKVNDVWQYMIHDAEGQLVAEYGTPAEGSGGVKFVQQDWQGSVRAITNNNGHVVSRTDHQAFGEDIGVGKGLRSIEQGYASDPPARQGYGLTEEDEGTGQDHTWARKLETQGGRFSSPDPSNGSMNLMDPQTMNKYAYVKNEPTTFIDPTGLEMMICEIRNGELNCTSSMSSFYGADRGYGATSIRIQEYRQYLDRDRFNFNTSLFVSYEYGSVFNGFSGGGAGCGAISGGGGTSLAFGGGNDSPCDGTCLKREERECESKGREYFNKNAVSEAVIQGLGLPASLTALKALTWKRMLVYVAQKLFWVATVLSVVYSIYQTTQSAVAIENECRDHIPDKCGAGCKKYLPKVGRA